jgi:hypothetical protein
LTDVGIVEIGCGGKKRSTRLRIGLRSIIKFHGAGAAQRSRTMEIKIS